MARLNPRLAAGVGVVSVFLLIGGPGVAVALADPGGSHSEKDDISNGDGGNGRGGSEGNDDVRGSGNGGNHLGDETAKRNIDAGPRVRIGSGRDDQEWLAPGGAVASDESGASGRTGPSERSGADQRGAPPPGFEPPRVTFGNGRSPSSHSNGPEPHWQAPAPEPPPPPPPPPVAPAPPPSLVDRIYTPPAAVTKQLGVAPAADWSDPLWGIAGLLLIPAAGAALGYRQARAAHAVDRLRRT